METIDYKQKIKDYMNSSDVDTLYKSMLNNLFPELKVSEDEKIRKEILDYIIKGSESCYDIQQYGREKFEKWIVWLEKQGEHANFRNKIQIGDKVTRNEDGVLVNLSQLNRVAKKQGEQKPAKFDDTNAKRMFIKALERVEEQNAKGYKLTDCDKNSWWEDFKAFCSEQNLANSAKTCKDEQDAAWSEKYIADVFEKVGLAKIVREQSNDALTNAIQDAMIELSKFIPQQNSTWSEEDEAVLDALIRRLEGEDVYVSPHLAVECLKSLKDRVQPKQGWGEEDEEMCAKTLFALAGYRGNEDKIDWLKSLKDRYTWKPSDEQMAVLNEVINYAANSDLQHWSNFIYTLLKSLREQLKKLRRE